MIHIITSNHGDQYDKMIYISSVWDIDQDNPEELYREYMNNEAKNMNLVINTHWLNVADHKNNNSHLNEREYLEKKKFFTKFSKRFTLEKFIEEKLGGRKLKFKDYYVL